MSSVFAFRVPVADMLVPVIAPATAPPIVTPSIAPPLMSTEPDVIVVNVPAAEVVPPIATLSIAEVAAPSISTTPSTSNVLPAPIVTSNAVIDLPAPPERLAESIIPPEILSPEIWSFARVKVPPERSIEPPVIATEPEFCTAIEPKPKFERAVVLPPPLEASTPRPPFTSPKAPVTALELVKSNAP